MKSKKSTIIMLISIVIAIVGSISVVGILQTTERVSTSGIIIQSPPPPPLPPPALPIYPPPPEPTLDINVYCDSECSVKATNIQWGSIEVGQSITNTIYIKNDGDYAVLLNLQTQNWNPLNAAENIQLSWDYDGNFLSPNEVISVTLTLTVDTNISGIDSFNFDIVLVGEPA